MSRERELLLVALDYLSTVGWSEEDRFVIVKLAENIRELLAQPEQHGTQYLLDQVAILTAENAMLKEKWSTSKQSEQKQEEKYVGIVRTIGGYPDNSEHTVELICRHGDLRDGDLLYTAPPKRTSLELEIADVCGSEDYREGFKDGALYAEKAHGIGGGE